MIHALISDRNGFFQLRYACLAWPLGVAGSLYNDAKIALLHSRFTTYSVIRTLLLAYQNPPHLDVVPFVLIAMLACTESDAFLHRKQSLLLSAVAVKSLVSIEQLSYS